MVPVYGESDRLRPYDPPTSGGTEQQLSEAIRPKTSDLQPAFHRATCERRMLRTQHPAPKALRAGSLTAPLRLPLLLPLLLPTLDTAARPDRRMAPRPADGHPETDGHHPATLAPGNAPTRRFPPTVLPPGTCHHQLPALPVGAGQAASASVAPTIAPTRVAPPSARTTSTLSTSHSMPHATTTTPGHPGIRTEGKGNHDATACTDTGRKTASQRADQSELSRGGDKPPSPGRVDLTCRGSRPNVSLRPGSEPDAGQADGPQGKPLDTTSHPAEPLRRASAWAVVRACRHDRKFG